MLCLYLRLRGVKWKMDEWLKMYKREKTKRSNKNQTQKKKKKKYKPEKPDLEKSMTLDARNTSTNRHWNCDSHNDSGRAGGGKTRERERDAYS